MIKESEAECLTCNPASNLHGVHPSEVMDVAIPQVVKDSLSEAIKEGNLPLSDKLVTWMEKKVAEFNLVDPEHICADSSLVETGKSWSFYPEIADIITGFSFYPDENP